MEKEVVTPQINLNLTDIVPQWAELKLKDLPESLKLRPFDLNDDAWLLQNFGEGFDLMKLTNYQLARIAFHQVTNDDKLKWFKQKETEIVDEKGQSVMQMIGGLDVFFACIQGMGDKVALYSAILANAGLSSPVITQFEKELLEKKSQEAQAMIDRQPGPKFSISFRPSTDGQPSKYYKQQDANSRGDSKKSTKGKTKSSK